MFPRIKVGRLGFHDAFKGIIKMCLAVEMIGQRQIGQGINPPYRNE